MPPRARSTSSRPSGLRTALRRVSALGTAVALVAVGLVAGTPVSARAADGLANVSASPSGPVRAGTTVTVTFTCGKLAYETAFVSAQWVLDDLNAPEQAVTFVREETDQRVYQFTYAGGSAATLWTLCTYRNTGGAPNWRMADSVAYTVLAAPAAPTGLTATPGAGAVTLTWDAASDPARPVTSYRVQVSADGGSSWADGPATSGTSATVTGLQNGTGYAFRVVGTGSEGTGAPSASATATPRTVPGAVTSLAAAGGAARVDASWAPPASDGGAPVVEYLAEISGDGGATWSTMQVTGTTAAAAGLVNGREHRVRVTAVNVAGGGQATETGDPAGGSGCADGRDRGTG